MTNLSSNGDIFINISSVLTGKSLSELIKTWDAENHFNKLIMKNAPWNLALFFETSQDILRKYQDEPEKLREVAIHQLMAQSKFNGLAKKICVLWETGNWPEAST